MKKCTIKPEAFSQFLLEILSLGLRILREECEKVYCYLKKCLIYLLL